MPSAVNSRQHAIAAANAGGAVRAILILANLLSANKAFDELIASRQPRCFHHQFAERGVKSPMPRDGHHRGGWIMRRRLCRNSFAGCGGACRHFAAEASRHRVSKTARFAGRHYHARHAELWARLTSLPVGVSQQNTPTSCLSTAR